MGPLKLLQISNGIQVDEKGLIGKLSTQLAVVQMPGWSPFAQIGVTSHSVMVCFPTVMNFHI